MRVLAWFIVASGFLYGTATNILTMFVEIEPWRRVHASVEYGVAFIILMHLKPEWFKKES